MAVIPDYIVKGSSSGRSKLIASVTAFSPNDGPPNALVSQEINTAGATALFAVCSAGAFSLAGPILDSKANIWQQVGPQPAIGPPNNVSGVIFYCLDPIVGSHHAFMRNAPGNMACLMMVFAFGGRRFQFDRDNTVAVLPGSSVRPGPLTPTQPGELFITSVADADFLVVSRSINAGFTLQEQHGYADGSGGSPVHCGGAFAYKEQSGAAATEDPSWNLGVSTTAAGLMACFKAPEGSGAFPDYIVKGLGNGAESPSRNVPDYIIKSQG